MEEFEIKDKNKDIILALGAESAGNFSVFKNGTVYFSKDFGDLMDEQNFSNFKVEVLKFLKEKKIKPTAILSDLHPEFKTTLLAQELATKYKVQYLPVQHHLAHVFSSVGDRIIRNSKFKIQNSFIGLACDGTGFGLDEKIWGGEAFEITKKQETKTKQISNSKFQITRIGHLENQILLGGEMAIKQPARLLISILAKIPNDKLQIPNKPQKSISKSKKDLVYYFIKKFHTKNEFEVLWNQLEQNFNCIETSSTARILDAVSVLLGFSKNERLSKHGPIALLEENSTKPYDNLQPNIERYKIQDTRYKQIPNSKFQIPNEMLVLNTTYLFEYLIKNLHKDKSRLAATAQKYITGGLWEICHQSSVISHSETAILKQLRMTNDRLPVFFAGGMANNSIMSESLTSHGAYTNKKIPRGDAGLSFGQIFYYILTNTRD